MKRKEAKATLRARTPSGAERRQERTAPPPLDAPLLSARGRPGRQEAVDERGSAPRAGGERRRPLSVSSAAAAAATRSARSAPAPIYFNGGAGLRAAAGAGRPPGRSAGRPRPPLRLRRHRLAGRRRGRKENQVQRRLGPRDFPRRPQLQQVRIQNSNSSPLETKNYSIRCPCLWVYRQFFVRIFLFGALKIFSHYDSDQFLSQNKVFFAKSLGQVFSATAQGGISPLFSQLF